MSESFTPGGVPLIIKVNGVRRSLKGTVKEQWGKLADDDLGVIASKQEQAKRKQLSSFSRMESLPQSVSMKRSRPPCGSWH